VWPLRVQFPPINACEETKVANALTKEANQLASIALSGDVFSIKQQFETLFKACKSCHKKFRSKD
jgi:cytochrome c556